MWMNRPFSGGHAVGRQFHHERHRFAFEDGSAKKVDAEDGDEDADDVDQPHHRAAHAGGKKAGMSKA